jgi:ribonuclease P protein component
VVVGLLGESEQPAVAFALPRTVGTAVVRNRLRRQLRAAARDLEQQELLPPATYLVIVRPPARGAPMTTLRGHLLRAVQHATASSATQQAR